MLQLGLDTRTTYFHVDLVGWVGLGWVERETFLAPIEVPPRWWSISIDESRYHSWLAQFERWSRFEIGKMLV